MFEVLIVNDVSCDALRAQCSHIQSQVGECNQVVSRFVHETADLGFPQTETFMSVDDGASFKIYHVDTVNVDVNCFEAHN